MLQQPCGHKCDHYVTVLLTLLLRWSSEVAPIGGARGRQFKVYPSMNVLSGNMESALRWGIVLPEKDWAECRRHSAQSRSDSVRSQTWWLGLRFSLLTAFRCKLSNHGLLQLFDIHAIPLGSVRE